MSWREILVFPGAEGTQKAPSAFRALDSVPVPASSMQPTSVVLPHYPQNTHNSPDGHSAHSADCARSKPDAEIESHLREILASAWQGHNLRPTHLLAALAPGDIEDLHAGRIGPETLVAFAQAVMQRQAMARGERPAHYAYLAHCCQCGPVWLWHPGQVRSCTWCVNRSQGQPIPRPVQVCCANCRHFHRSGGHPHLGHCAQGMPEAIAGLWDTDLRWCTGWLPRSGQGDEAKMQSRGPSLAGKCPPTP
jgi:hypothetical protein